MEYYSEQIDNDHDLPLDSNLHINLSYRRRRPGEDTLVRNIESFGENGTRAPLWLVPGPWLDNCDALSPSIMPDNGRIPHEVNRLFPFHQNNLLCGDPETGEPMYDPLAHIPTFSFEPPDLRQEDPPSRSSSLDTVATQPGREAEQLLPSQAMHTSHHQTRRRTEYDEKTMRDFQQHCGVINFGGRPVYSGACCDTTDKPDPTNQRTRGSEHSQQLKSSDQRHNVRQRTNR